MHRQKEDKVSPAKQKKMPLQELLLNHKADMNETTFKTKSAERCLEWIIFPILLFLQFEVTMHCEFAHGDEVKLLDWRVVHVTILVFCLMGGIYRQIMRLYHCQSTVLMLLPELFTNLVLGRVLFGSVFKGYELLVILTFVLLFIATIAFIQISLRKNENSDNSNNDFYLLPSIEEDTNTADDGESDCSMC